MRKHIAILMLVCANVLLFAHSVVAHHHHDGVIAFCESAQNYHAEHSHCEDSSEHHHNHHGGDDPHSNDGHKSEECSLNNMTTPRDSQKETLNFVVLYVAAQNFLLLDISDINNTNAYGEYQEIGYAPPGIHYSGLRGPPSC